jgi:tetratricopeptide (TPR) repeat protein
MVGSDPHVTGYELCSEARRLEQAGDARAAVAIYDTVVARFGDSADTYIQDLVVYAITHRAALRAANPDLASAAEPTGALVARLERTDEPGQRERLARAILSESVLLRRNERHDEAIALSQSLVDALQSNDSSEVRGSAALACQNVVEFLNGQGRTAEAERALSDLAARFGEELLEDYDEALAESADADDETRLGLLYRRAELLRGLGRTDDAVAALTQLISEFGDAAEFRPVLDRANERRAELRAG